MIGIQVIRRMRKILKIRLYIFLVNKIFAGTNSKHYEVKRKLLNRIGYNIGEGTKIVGLIYNTGNLTVGKNCWIGKNFTVNGNGAVMIGDNCDIAPDVVFQTGSHNIGSSERRAGKGYNADITVGNGTWIGVRATILSDVKIGNSCVIAACACVTKNIDDNVLAGGVPAKQIKDL